MTSLFPVPDVFVIGGGPAGLAAAIAARQRGFEVTVADAAAPPIDKACGEGIMPDVLAAARKLGLELDIPEAQPFRGILFSDSDAQVRSLFPQGHGVGLRRTLLHGMMVDRAQALGVRLRWGARVTGLRGPTLENAAVEIDGSLVRTRYIIGADGGNSRVRRWAGLDASLRDSRRYGFRRHYEIAPWSDHMEIHWGNGMQLYVTPVAGREICLVLISRNPRLRLDDALPEFPEITRRLESARAATSERGAVSATRRLRRVTRGNIALTGDASGSVDAITGDGLCLLFEHAAALGEAMSAGDLSRYEAAHRNIGKRPALMSDLMLLMCSHDRLRRRAMRAFAAEPRLFERMLATHVGKLSISQLLSNGAALGWRILTI
jgi:flavin-dependent dehydrogenase